MGTEANRPAAAYDTVGFDEFYDRALPVVFGYLLRLCGGDREQAWDLTQDSWVIVVDRLSRGESDKATVGFLLSVACVRYRTAWALGNALEYPVWLICGFLVPLALLPSWVGPISWVLAPTFGVRAIREAALGGTPVGDLLACAGLGVAYFSIGIALAEHVLRMARKTAALCSS